MKSSETQYTEDDLRNLKQRAITDRLCKIAYNQYLINKGNVYRDLYNSLLTCLQTEIIDKIKNRTLTKKENDSFTKAIIDLFDSLPSLTKGMDTLEKLANVNNIDTNPAKENKSPTQIIKGIRNEKNIDGLS